MCHQLLRKHGPLASAVLRHQAWHAQLGLGFSIVCPARSATFTARACMLRAHVFAKWLTHHWHPGCIPGSRKHVRDAVGVRIGLRVMKPLGFWCIRNLNVKSGGRLRVWGISAETGVYHQESDKLIQHAEISRMLQVHVFVKLHEHVHLQHAWGSLNLSEPLLASELAIICPSTADSSCACVQLPADSLTATPGTASSVPLLPSHAVGHLLLQIINQMLWHKLVADVAPDSCIGWPCRPEFPVPERAGNGDAAH